MLVPDIMQQRKQIKKVTFITSVSQGKNETNAEKII